VSTLKKSVATKVSAWAADQVPRSTST